MLRKWGFGAGRAQSRCQVPWCNSDKKPRQKNSVCGGGHCLACGPPRLTPPPSRSRASAHHHTEFYDAPVSSDSTGQLSDATGKPTFYDRPDAQPGSGARGPAGGRGAQPAARARCRSLLCPAAAPASLHSAPPPLKLDLGNKRRGGGARSGPLTHLRRPLPPDRRAECQRLGGAHHDFRLSSCVLVHADTS